MIIVSFLYILLCGQVLSATESSFTVIEEGILGAFGDFNSDELTDVFVIVNSSIIQVYLAYDKEPFFRPSHFKCDLGNLNITSVVPGDYDGDAYMDILITTELQNQNISNLHEIRILWGGMPSLNCTDALQIKALTIDQPLILDYNRDMIMDLFGLNIQNQRTFWIFKQDRETPSEIIQTDDFYKQLKQPHSHSFLDFNGDNAADLLVTTTNDVEIWLSSSPNGFTYFESLELLLGHPAIYGQALFTDVTLSGQFYLVIPVCYDLLCYNSTILIYGDKQWYDLNIDLNDGKGTVWRFVPPRNETYLDTITMRSGDYNMDGYPDIIMTLCPLGSDETKVFLLHNLPCSEPGCIFHRTYVVKWDMFDSFGKDVVMGTFYDFNMDGVLDVIYVKKNKTVDGLKYSIHAYRNGLDNDMNFIKVIVVTGLTNEKIPFINGTLYNRKVTFGTNLPGPRVSYGTWSQEGTYRTGLCAQLPQSAYFALQLPYSIFGLDRTPNFVDTLKVGLLGFERSWTQIIPNSQIVVVPSPLDDASQWKAQLFVTPSKLILKSVFVLTAILAIIVSVILYLHFKEKSDHEDIVEIDERCYVKI